MTDPRPGPNEVTDPSYWDEEWSRLEDLVVQVPRDDFYFGADGLFARLIRRRVGDLTGRTVVEFGGGGVNYRLLAMSRWLGARVTAIDYSPVGLRAVRRLFQLNECTGRFIEGDIQTWSPVEPCDCVVHWGVLEHFADPLPLIEQSGRCLRPGGTLMFSMPNMEAIGAAFWKQWSPDNWAHHIHHSTPIIVASLREAGFVDVQSFHYGIPFLKMADWERPSSLSPLVDVGQRLLSASARLFPVFDRIGHRWLSMERGFLAVRR